MATSCTTPTEKTTTTVEKTTVIDPNGETARTNADYMAEIESYRKTNADRITANEKSMADLKAQIAQEKAEARAENERRLAALEQKNKDLKMKMDNFKGDTKESWDSFKVQYARDMDQLGQDFRDLSDKK